MTQNAANHSPLLEYFSRVEIIHLRERKDRYDVLVRELARIGIDINNDRIEIPDAPRPGDSQGFPSRQIYGNFLSHLDILRRARNNQCPAVLVLEDDAIFRTFLADAAFQRQLVKTLEIEPWDICYFGHPITNQLLGQPHGLIRSDLTFKWAHCYAVHQRALNNLVEYLEATAKRPVGDPMGGKMYIDGALSLYRKKTTNLFFTRPRMRLG